MKTKGKLAGRSLFINCATDQAKIALFSDGKIIAKKIIESRSELSDKLLVEINQLAEKHHFYFESIRVFSGPGSYTGLRVGITTANFLAWSLKIPIYKADAGGNIISEKKDYILPIYLQDPHITKPKST
ncbi:MAG: tRNA (adenosine(37)-N6)-threonylcarbamoyltransferase complex dimerization subunit type 1 TsaB [Candidatus Berkelbacteria bacterium]|nr:tRNA (adenosine(37)-N6)-threonylcarbamoyltransferase complex dimerization subunit type 1 TsaB [Candidatus Berkelbacteria bacterium]